MPFVDFLIWILGVCGFAHFLVVKNSIQDKIFWNRRNNPESKLYIFLETVLCSRLLTCPACLSFVIALVFVGEYFPSEILLTKVLVCFATYAFTLFTLRLSDDSY